MRVSGNPDKFVVHPLPQTDFLQCYRPCYNAELQVFVETVAKGEQMSPGFQAGKRALQLADAAKSSHIRGEQVTVKLGQRMPPEPSRHR